MTKRIAEALVECGYADSVPTTFNFIPHEGVEYVQMAKKPDPFQANQYQEVNPFADTLEGRRQLEELFDHLFVKWRKNDKIHELTQVFLQDIEKGIREAKIKFIKACFEQLEAQSDE